MTWNDKKYFKIRSNYRDLEKVKERLSKITDPIVRGVLEKDIKDIKDGNEYLEGKLKKRMDKIFEGWD